jgi:hypothetical protein
MIQIPEETGLGARPISADHVSSTSTLERVGPGRGSTLKVLCGVGCTQGPRDHNSESVTWSSMSASFVPRLFWNYNFKSLKSLFNFFLALSRQASSTLGMSGLKKSTPFLYVNKSRTLVSEIFWLPLGKGCGSLTPSLSQEGPRSAFLCVISDWVKCALSITSGFY